ncbi:hypothetical protein GH714_004178 [Hevea brasiliensis]|uniref:Uncharacterized protein n=1 Tax=Hevea brasiliensis TaxID=3981 RepID=A0A6A6KYP7_HEVBR|nr:hypothetical protein GH714_004178 [Hevea brasiliensis]
MDEEIIDCDPNSSNLQHLKIDDCGSLTFLGKLPPSLKDLVITSFGFDLEIGAKLESIAERFNSTTSLESIKIGYLLILNLYPKPPHARQSPQHLDIQLSKSCIFPAGRLTSLKKLSITGKCHRMVSFPQDEIDMKLPASLTSLTIEGFQDLIYLSNKGFQSLTSLEYLRIERCPKLAYFPTNGRLPLCNCISTTALYFSKGLPDTTTEEEE